MCTGFWCGNLCERDHWIEPDVDGRIILRWMEGRDEHKFLLGKREERDHWVQPDVDRRIILRWMECRDERRLLVGKPERKRPLEKPRRRWEDYIKIDGGQRCIHVSGG
jgi:hypothetical protein